MIQIFPQINNFFLWIGATTKKYKDVFISFGVI